MWRNHKTAPTMAALAPATPGDFNGSGQVTTADFGTWKGSYGSTSNLIADGNGDGRVNAADYTIWRNQLNVAAGSGSGGSSGDSVVASSGESVGGGAGSAAIYEVVTPSIVATEVVESTFATVAPLQAEDLSLLLAVSHTPSTSVEKALEAYGSGSSADSDSDSPASLDELALAAVWQSWDEL